MSYILYISVIVLADITTTNTDIDPIIDRFLGSLVFWFKRINPKIPKPDPSVLIKINTDSDIKSDAPILYLLNIGLYIFLKNNGIKIILSTSVDMIIVANTKIQVYVNMLFIICFFSMFEHEAIEIGTIATIVIKIITKNNPKNPTIMFCVL